MNNHDRHEYDIEYFKGNGFVRKRCKKCGSWFWTRDRDRDTCGDAPCEIYLFIGAPLFKERSLEEIRESFLSFFELRNHTRMKRYPVVARWRDDIYLNIASIANFQPLITSGSVPPPANPLVISQPCIRLEDLHSIGKSGRHLTMFEMMGHHAFNKRGEKEIYWKSETVQYCDEFLKQLGVAEEGVTYKEAPWVGGGNAGPCLEVIAGGLELATLVFMDLEAVHQPGNGNGDSFIGGQWYRKMETYIVDTGYGLERFVWASKGTPTVYDAIFPEVIEELLGSVGMEHPEERYYNELVEIARLSGVMDKRAIAKKLQLSDTFINNTLEPLETVYAVADHTRCLAFMLADGIVPSNAKEGYLARLVIRRALRMLKSLQCDMPLEELVALHIKQLRKSFPELMESVDMINEMLALEKRRYEETLSKGERIIRQMMTKRKGEGISVDTLINLYDTYGIPPEFTREVASRVHPHININIPEDFYSRVARMHGEAKRQEEDMALVSLKERTKSIPKTRRLYYEEPESTVFSATVLDYFDKFIVLDRTLFYPEGGGQPADTGVIRLDDMDGGTVNELKVVDVRDVDGVILHEIDMDTDTDTDMDAIGIERGKQVSGSIDYRRRMAHTRHHSATHIVIWAARKVLGRHVWQAGAQKGELRSRLDITHFKRISDAEKREIEKLANEMVMRVMRI